MLPISTIFLIIFFLFRELTDPECDRGIPEFKDKNKNKSKRTGAEQNKLELGRKGALEEKFVISV